MSVKEYNFKKNKNCIFIFSVQAKLISIPILGTGVNAILPGEEEWTSDEY